MTPPKSKMTVVYVKVFQHPIFRKNDLYKSVRVKLIKRKLQFHRGIKF